MAVAAQLLELRPPRTRLRSVSVVLVAYNSGGALLRCLAMIDQDDEGVQEIVIVNNGDHGDELDIAARSPRVRLITTQENVGFGAGCNLGAAHATGDVLVFLNPDTVIAPGAIAELVDTLEDESIGIAMARLRLLDAPELLNSGGNVVHISGLGWAGRYAQPAEELTDVHEIASPSGAAMAMRSDDFRALGGFREELFLYHEDQELGWRVHMLGRRVVINPRADVYHEYDFWRHTNKRYFLERNRLAFLALEFSARTLVVLAPVLAATELAMCALALKQGWLRDKVRGWAWFVRSARVIARHRRDTQRARKLSDRELARLLTPTLDAAMIALPAVVRLVNPLLRAYWALAVRAI